MELIIFIVFIAFWMSLSRVKSRLSRVEQLLAQQGAPVSSAAPVAESMAQPVSVGSAAPPQAAPPVSVVPQKPAEPSLGDAFGAWMAEDWLLKLGAFVLLLGMGWFVSYAFANDWIGPIGRVTLGIILGVSVLGYGYSRMHTYVRQGSVFLGVGAMIILLSAYSAAFDYKIVSGYFALAIALLTMAFTSLASVRFNVRSLAIVSLIIASIAPTTLLLMSSAPSNAELFGYLFVVLLGGVWIITLTGWRELALVSLVMYFLYAFPRFISYGHDGGSLLLWSYVFAILFFVVNTTGILKARDNDIQADIITALLNGALLLISINVYAAPEWKSLVTVGWMFVFLVTAFAIFAITKRREPFFVYAGVAIAMLGSATANELEGASLTIAYILEAAMAPFVAYMIMHERKIAETLTLLLCIPGLLSVGSIAANWHSSIPFDHFFVLLLMTGSLLLLGLFFAAIPRDNDGQGDMVTPALFITGSMFGYILLWLSLHAQTVITSYDTATMVCLVIYTIIGLIAYAYGKGKDMKEVVYYGGGLLGFTLAHLLLVDVWDMNLAGRIVTFVVVGTLLMGTAFLGRKNTSLPPQI